MPYRVATNSDRFQLNTNSWQAQGLVGWWPLGAYPDARDMGQFGNNGTRTNGPVASASGPRRAMSFDATNDFIELLQPALLVGMPYTLSWWEKVMSDAGTYPSRFCLSLFGTTNKLVVLRVKNDTSYTYLTWGEAPGVSRKSEQVTSPLLSVGIWKHFAIAGASTAASLSDRVYEDGNDKAVGALSGFGGIVQNRIGWDGADSPADCLMDDVRMYNRALSAAQIRSIYNQTLNGSYGDLAIMKRKTWRVATGNRRRRLLTVCGG